MISLQSESQMTAYKPSSAGNQNFHSAESKVRPKSNQAIVAIRILPLPSLDEELDFAAESGVAPSWIKKWGAMPPILNLNASLD
jgi:hypothetical protein